MLKGANVQQRIIIRNVLNAIGIFGIILFLLVNPRSYYLLIGSAAALFLGITGFSRQCPLILSVQHHLNRMKSKRQSQVP
jgi:hypothetical protein